MTEKMTKTFIADEIDQKIITEKATSMGNSSDSAAIRAIIREWAALVKMVLPPTPQGKE